MNEQTLQLIASLKIVWVALFSYFYGLGGINHKWLRRFLGAFWMGVGAVTFGCWQGVFQWWHLIYPVLSCMALHLGYGGDRVVIKISKRFIYGLCLGIAALPLCFNSGLWVLFGFHVALCISASVVFGVVNPTREARSEETIIASLSTIIPLFLI